MTMRTLYITMTALALAFAVSAPAQKRTRMTAAERAKAEKEAKEAQQRIDLMTSATQRVIFIDSVVVDKDSFLEHYSIGREAGSLHTNSEFFGQKEQSEEYVYLNEFGDKCYFALADTTGETSLYSCDMFDGKWSTPEPLRGLGNETQIKSPNYPFMMADGTTLYFAAKGSESIGGYDIFVTRFNSGSGQFLRPENIGMPFNSTANDYMYAVDEYNGIGWFATDRNQPEGKVCIYMFVPTSTRQIYSPDMYSEEQIRNFANLESIAATWEDGKERAEALARLKAITPATNDENDSPLFSFVIDDNRTYTKLSDFRDKQNVLRYKQLNVIQSEIAATEQALEKAREQYSQATGNQREALKSSILADEDRLLKLDSQANEMAKEIRNTENSLK